MIFQIKIEIKHNHAMIKYLKSYVVVIILAKNIYFKKKGKKGDLSSFSTPSVFAHVHTVSKIIGRVIRVPFPITA